MQSSSPTFALRPLLHPLSLHLEELGDCLVSGNKGTRMLGLPFQDEWPKCGVCRQLACVPSWQHSGWPRLPILSVPCASPLAMSNPSLPARGHRGSTAAAGKKSRIGLKWLRQDVSGSARWKLFATASVMCPNAGGCSSLFPPSSHCRNQETGSLWLLVGVLNCSSH